MRALVAVALLVALALAAFASPFASSQPDGLQRVAEDAGFAGQGVESPLAGAAPAPGYSAPGAAPGRLSTTVAGVGGTLAVLGLGACVAGGLRRRARRAG